MTTQSDRWLTIRQAALELNVSELTVRRRIKDGKLTSRLRSGKYYVKIGPPRAADPDEQAELMSNQMADPVPARAADSEDGQRAPATPSLDLAAILPEVARLAEEAGRSAVLREQVRQLEERVNQLQQGTIALAGRNGWLESKLEERERELKLLTDTQPKRPWWRRLLGSG